MKELRRILKSTGISSHQVDLNDHLGGALNTLISDFRDNKISSWCAFWCANFMNSIDNQLNKCIY
jgi:hypothetical protein